MYEVTYNGQTSSICEQLILLSFGKHYYMMLSDSQVSCY